MWGRIAAEVKRVDWIETAGERCELHVIDQWCHLGTVKNEQELHELQEDAPRPLFDHDTYKILTRYLLTGKKNPDIIPLTTSAAPAA